MSSVNVAGRALYATDSSRSASDTSGMIASSVSSEYIISTTVHSSVPCDGLRPARCSSHENIPVACPWTRSSASSRVNTARRSPASPDCRDQTPGALRPIATLTPWVAPNWSLIRRPPAASVNCSRSRRVTFSRYGKSRASFGQSNPCPRTFAARSSSHGSLVRSCSQ